MISQEKLEAVFPGKGEAIRALFDGKWKPLECSSLSIGPPLPFSLFTLGGREGVLDDLLGVLPRDTVHRDLKKKPERVRSERTLSESALPSTPLIFPEQLAGL